MNPPITSAGTTAGNGVVSEWQFSRTDFMCLSSSGGVTLRVFWISLHDWNLLAVAFNPDAKTFVGLDNCRHLFRGRSKEWGLTTRPLLQFLSLTVLVITGWHAY